MQIHANIPKGTWFENIVIQKILVTPEYLWNGWEKWHPSGILMPQMNRHVCNICCISSLIRKNKTDYILKDHSISNENLKIGKVKSGFLGTNTKERATTWQSQIMDFFVNFLILYFLQIHTNITEGTGLKNIVIQKFWESLMNFYRNFTK